MSSARVFVRLFSRCGPRLPATLAPFNKSSAFHNRCLLSRSCNLVVALQRRSLFQDASKHEVFGEDRVRVYYGILTPHIRTVKWFSLTTSLIGIMAQPFMYKELMALENVPLMLAAYSFVGLFTFVTPFLLHLVTKKYVTHLDYNEKTGSYIATTVNFFCMFKETEFKPDQVKVPDIPGMFTTFTAKGTPLFLEARLFEDPSHYAKIMGYDKPIDLRNYDTEPEEKTDKK